MNEEKIHHLIRCISNRMRAIGDANMKEKGLTYSQLQVLIAIDRHDGITTQKQLEHELNVSHPTMVGLLQRLEKNAYVDFENDSVDKRIKVVKLNRKAKKLKEETIKEIKQMSDRMYRRLNDKEKKELQRMLKIINEDLNDDKGGCA